MAYYPPWLDVATWLSAIGAVLCWLAMQPISPGRKRGMLKLSACCLAAIAFAFGGTANLLFNSRAPHIATHGQFSQVTIHTGKGSSTSFNLSGPLATRDRLHMSGARSAIENGEAAEVVYQAESGNVLSVHIADGPYAGTRYSDSDSSSGGVFALLAATFLAFYGVINFLTDGTATPAVRNNTPPPPGDADTGSMLNLDGRETSPVADDQPAPRGDVDSDSILKL